MDGCHLVGGDELLCMVRGQLDAKENEKGAV